jgi:hypothetical protein
MIDPKELRIGNWIRSTAQGHIQVRANDIEKIESVFLKGQDYVQPIPLTTEWLERLGFEKRESGVCYEWWNGINEVTHDWLVSITEMKDNGQFFYRNGKHTIKYVHQLQNLFFALTGEEL